MPDKPAIKVLFVCLGNICRSPTAEAVFRSLVRRAGLDTAFKIDSAGTEAWHVGKGPDLRTQRAAKNRGIDMSSLKARQVVSDDFKQFDYIFAMDAENLSNLKTIQPKESRAKISLLLEEFGTQNRSEVPDPYYGGSDGFEEVLDLLEGACSELLESLT